MSIEGKIAMQIPNERSDVIRKVANCSNAMFERVKTIVHGRPSMTQGERRVFDFIVARHKYAQTIPSMREIALQLGYKSETSVRQYLDALERKGYIKRNKRRACDALIIE